MKGLIIAGGTGGHIIPGIAILEAFTDNKRNSVKIEMLSAERNRNFSDFEDIQSKLHFYNPPRITKNILKLPIFIILLVRAMLRSRSLLKKIKPDFVVGMGGYTMLPMLLTLRFFNIPYYLCEQNAIPGKATRFFATRARKIFLNIPIDENYKWNIENKKTLIVGNPIKKILQKKWQNLKTIKSNNLKLKRILVLGGSQGAMQLNQMCQDVIIKNQNLKNNISKIHWQIQCGQKNLDSMQMALPKKIFKNVNLFGYHSSIGELMAKADLLIGRSGAGVLSEATYFSLPMLLVPYPWSSDDHQKANANYYEKNGAAIAISTNENDSEALNQILMQWFLNPKDMLKRSKKSAKLALPDAAKKIQEFIIDDLQ